MFSFINSISIFWSYLSFGILDFWRFSVSSLSFDLSWERCFFMYAVFWYVVFRGLLFLDTNYPTCPSQFFSETLIWDFSEPELMLLWLVKSPLNSVAFLREFSVFTIAAWNFFCYCSSSHFWWKSFYFGEKTFLRSRFLASLTSCSMPQRSAWYCFSRPYLARILEVSM